MSKPTLEHLLAPTDLATFANEIWEKKHLHILRNDPNYYANILKLEDLDEYLSRNDIRYPSLRMIHAGRPIPVTDFSQPFKFGTYASEGLIDVDRVHQFHMDGASIVLQLMRSSIKSVAVFANRLQRDVLFNIEATIYLTPPGEQGFTTHYDTHSVFVLQVAGCKEWRLYDFPKRYPLLSDSFNTIRYSPTAPSYNVTLNPGDMLYVPRGLAHDANAVDDAKSIHITVGLFPPTWSDLFETQFLNLEQEARFRRAPVGFFLRETHGRFAETCAHICRKAFVKTDGAKLLADTLRQHLTRQARMTGGVLPTLLEAPTIQPSTRLRARENVTWQIEETSDNIVVYFYNKRLVMPRTVRLAVDRLLSGLPSRVDQLQDNLEAESSILLCRKFLEAGLVEILS